MITVIFLLTIIGFYMLLLTSQRAEIPKTVPEKKIVSQHKTIFKTSGLFILIIAFIISCLQWGLAAGIITEFIILSILASLLVLLIPMQLINYKQLTVLFILSLTFELYLTYAG